MQQHDHVPPGFAESKRPVLGADVPSLCDVIRNRWMGREKKGGIKLTKVY